MDSERFDHLTRKLASGQSRRSLLKGLTGTAIGGVLAAVGIAEASAKGPCKAPNTKYGKGRYAVCCTPGQTYNASTNACDTPPPPPTCLAEGEAYGPDTLPCCSNCYSYLCAPASLCGG